jgi:HK97 family phage prohead protease
MRLISVETFRAGMRGERVPAGGVFRVSTVKPKALADGTRSVRFCFSDGSIDRMGDTIDPNGWDTSDFDANPVALWAHDSSQPPIGRAGNLAVEGGRLMGDIEFAPTETYAFADTVYRLVTGGFLNAVSVGFLPTEYSFVDNDPERGFGIDFKKQQLLEISVCPIPANPNALAAARSKGIDTRPLVEWAERTLDGGGILTIPKLELERLRKAAKEPTMARRAPAARRSDNDDNPMATCAKGDDEDCGMKDASRCAIHGKAKDTDPDDDAEKAIRRILSKLLARTKAEGDDADDDLPLEHHDAVRMAHKCMKTAKAFSAEAVKQYAKAMDHLAGVAESLDDPDDVDPDDTKSEDPDADGDDDEAPDAEKAAQLRRAAKLKRRLAI